MKIKALPLIAALSFALGAGPAAAGITWYQPYTTFEDNNLDFHLDGNDDGILDVGETLIAVFEIDQTASVIPAGSSAGITGGELTGIAAVQVVTKTATATPGRYDFTFGPHSAGLDAILTLAGLPELPGTLGDAGNGAMVAGYFDSTPDFDAVSADCTSLNDCVAKAGDGMLWEVDGFEDDPDEMWVAFNALDKLTDADSDTDSADDIGPSTKAAVVNYALSGMYNGTGHALKPMDCLGGCSGFGDGIVGNTGDPDTLFGVTGSGDVLGGYGLTNGAFGRSDFDFTKKVPEPASLALLAAGLLGVGGAARRRRKA